MRVCGKTVDFDRRQPVDLDGKGYGVAMQIIRQFMGFWAREKTESDPQVPEHVDADAPALQRLLARWIREKTKPLPPEAPKRVQQVFQALGFEATPDVLALYGAAGGMQAPDDVGWFLWPLTEVMAQSPSEHGVVFSDYMCSCWNYRLRPASAEHCAVYVDYYNGNPPTLVAASLDEFFVRYLVDADALMNWR